MSSPPTRSGVAGALAVLALGTQLLAGCSSAADDGAHDGAADDGTTRLMLFGDSITQGKAGDWTWRYRLWQHLEDADETSVDFVGPADDLQSNSLAYRDPDFDRDHAALWGATLTPPPYDPRTLAGVYRPDVVVVELGVNDLFQQQAPADVAASMRTTIEQLRKAAPGVDVVVVHVPVVRIAGVEELNLRYDELAEELDTAAERVVVARAEQGFVSDPSVPDTDSYDGLHPDASGEVKIAEAVADALAGLGIGD